MLSHQSHPFFPSIQILAWHGTFMRQITTGKEARDFCRSAGCPPSLWKMASSPQTLMSGTGHLSTVMSTHSPHWLCVSVHVCMCLYVLVWVTGPNPESDLNDTSLFTHLFFFLRNESTQTLPQLPFPNSLDLWGANIFMYCFFLLLMTYSYQTLHHQPLIQIQPVKTSPDCPQFVSLYFITLTQHSQWKTLTIVIVQFPNCVCVTPTWCSTVSLTSSRCAVMMGSRVKAPNPLPRLCTGCDAFEVFWRHAHINFTLRCLHLFLAFFLPS